MPANKRITRIVMEPSSLAPDHTFARAMWVNDDNHESGEVVANIDNASITDVDVVQTALLLEDSNLNFSL